MLGWYDNNFYANIVLQEDQDAMELDLDKDEEIQVDNSDSTGEKLLTEEYQAVAGSAKSKKRVSI